MIIFLVVFPYQRNKGLNSLALVLINQLNRTESEVNPIIISRIVEVNIMDPLLLGLVNNLSQFKECIPY
jgi:hypothetical protein